MFNIINYIHFTPVIIFVSLSLTRPMTYYIHIHFTDFTSLGIPTYAVVRTSHKKYVEFVKKCVNGGTAA